ncbi:MAG: type IV pilus assembly protein PilE [Pseudohongiellaceae bacterium]|jgi:type IV pilus assembly protein PilE
MKRNKGFTLIELMITVAIVGILASIAYPAYTEQVKSSRRADVKSVLISFAQAIERQYTKDGTYAGVDGDKTNDITTKTDPSATIFAKEAPLDGASKYYDLDVMIANSTSYTLRATPKSAQTGDGYLEITSTGSKGWDQNGTGTLVLW